jgi:RNA polymerase sigma-70 factor, ECF subfamily
VDTRAVPLPDLASDQIRRVLRRLPARERAAIVLHYGQNLTDNEVATVLGCRPTMARTLIGRGRRRLRIEVARDARLVPSHP